MYARCEQRQYLFCCSVSCAQDNIYTFESLCIETSGEISLSENVEHQGYKAEHSALLPFPQCDSEVDSHRQPMGSCGCNEKQGALLSPCELLFIRLSEL